MPIAIYGSSAPIPTSATATASGVVFAVRGNSFVAAYGTGNKQGSRSVAAGTVITSDGTAISGSVIDQSAGTSSSSVFWPGANNMPDGRAFSVLHRFKPGYSGTPAAAKGLWTLGYIATNCGVSVNLFHWTSGKLYMFARNENNQTPINVQTTSDFNPTSGTYYDVVFTWDGTTTANAVKLYLDGVLFQQSTATQAMSSSLTSNDWPAIIMGITANAISTNIKTDEFVIWNKVIDPTSVTFADGTTGSLNGASRTKLVGIT